MTTDTNEVEYIMIPETSEADDSIMKVNTSIYDLNLFINKANYTLDNITVLINTSEVVLSEVRRLIEIYVDLKEDLNETIYMTHPTINYLNTVGIKKIDNILEKYIFVSNYIYIVAIGVLIMVSTIPIILLCIYFKLGTLEPKRRRDIGM